MGQIELSPTLISRCKAHGHKIVEGYETTPDNSFKRSLALSVRGAEFDPVLQGKAKMSECAFAIWSGQDPLTSVHWGPNPDVGHDVRCGPVLVDVKSISGGDRLLIWSWRKTAKYLSYNFTAMVAVREAEPLFTVERWVDKLTFFRKHLTAGPDHRPRLDEGTWYMKLADVFEMGSLATYLNLCGLNVKEGGDR